MHCSVQFTAEMPHFYRNKHKTKQTVLVTVVWPLVNRLYCILRHTVRLLLTGTQYSIPPGWDGSQPHKIFLKKTWKRRKRISTQHPQCGLNTEFHESVDMNHWWSCFQAMHIIYLFAVMIYFYSGLQIRINKWTWRWSSWNQTLFA